MKALKCLAPAVALLLSAAAFAAPDDIKVCEVVPAGDVEGALGFKVAKTKPGYRECNWFSVTPSVSANAKAFKRHAHKVTGTEYVEQMKKMGFTAAILDDTPDLWCAKLTAPANMSGAQIVECRMLTKGHYFEIRAMGPQMTREKAKALVAKVAARLP